MLRLGEMIRRVLPKREEGTRCATGGIPVAEQRNGSNLLGGQGDMFPRATGAGARRA